MPYINPAVSGQIAGLVGLGGNLGGFVYGLCFRHLSYETTFAIMDVAALASTMIYAGVFIPGQATLYTRETSLEVINERVAAYAYGNGDDVSDTEESSDSQSPGVSSPRAPNSGRHLLPPVMAK